MEGGSGRGLHTSEFVIAQRNTVTARGPSFFQAGISWLSLVSGKDVGSW